MEIVARLQETIISPFFAIGVMTVAAILAYSSFAPKGEMALFNKAQMDDDSPLAFLIHMFSRGTARGTEERISLRPRWAFVLFAPLILFVLIFGIDWTGTVWPALFINDPVLQFAIAAFFLGLFCYVWVWQLLVHHVTYDRDTITIMDEYYRKQTRALDDFEGFEIEPLRPAFRMIFRDAPPLRIASNISYRTAFIIDMQTRLEQSGQKAEADAGPFRRLLMEADQAAEAKAASAAKIPRKISRF